MSATKTSEFAGAALEAWVAKALAEKPGMPRVAAARAIVSARFGGEVDG